MKLVIASFLLMTLFSISKCNLDENECIEQSRHFQSFSQSGPQEEELYPYLPAMKVFPWEEDSIHTENDFQKFFGKLNKSEGYFSHLDGLHNHNHRSFCPWRYEIDVDENRIPINIPRVVCDCNHCLNSAGNEMMHTKCKKIHYTIPVLKRSSNWGCHADRNIYYIVNEDIPVACACQRNPVIDMTL